MLPTKRSEAILQDNPRYSTGRPCGRGHFSERITTNGVCVECNAEDNRKRSGLLTASGRVNRQKRHDLLNIGGPTSREEAVEHDLEWYRFLGPSCHGIVGLDGVTCYVCGQAVSNAKLRLDLAAELLG